MDAMNTITTSRKHGYRTSTLRLLPTTRRSVIHARQTRSGTITNPPCSAYVSTKRTSVCRYTKQMPQEVRCEPGTCGSRLRVSRQMRGRRGACSRRQQQLPQDNATHDQMRDITDAAGFPCVCNYPKKEVGLTDNVNACRISPQICSRQLRVSGRHVL